MVNKRNLSIFLIVTFSFIFCVQSASKENSNIEKNESIEIKNFDKNGNLIFYKNFFGLEQTFFYDSQNRLIKIERNDGYFEIHDYDENGNEFHIKNSKGNEVWNIFDVNNNLINKKKSVGYEIFYEYDNFNRIVHEKDSEGFESWTIYDDEKNTQYYRNTNGFQEWKTFDNNNLMIYRKIMNKYNNVIEEWDEYDNQGKIIHILDTEEYEAFYFYQNDLLVRYSDSTNYEIWNSYSPRGKLITHRDSKGVLENYLYDKNDNLIYENYQDKKEEYSLEYEFYDDNSIKQIKRKKLL